MDVVVVMMLVFLVFCWRFILGIIMGMVFVLGVDFFGSISVILLLNLEFFCGLWVDVLYLIGGYKCCLEIS